MSWLKDLCETYERCQGLPQFAEAALNPVASMYQTTHICIRLDRKGTFLGAKFGREDRCLIPVTEASSGRSSQHPAPHPLSDKLRYCAGDFEQWTGEPSRFQDYYQLLSRWDESRFSHPKVTAVRRYVEKKTLVEDLVRKGVLFTETSSRICVKRPRTKANPSLNNQGDAFIRWQVKLRGDEFPNAWEDPSLFTSWIAFENTLTQSANPVSKYRPHRGLCIASGRNNTRLAYMHPRGIRFPGDGAKLISGNDQEGFTFRGRFRDSGEACGVSFSVTQKAHNALRWLIARQSDNCRPRGQVFVSWSIQGQAIPDPQKNTGQLFLAAPPTTPFRIGSNAGAKFCFASRLDGLISSYRTRLNALDGIAVMGLDSATQGRMAITFYRKLPAREFLERMRLWHERFAWWQSYPAEKFGSQGQLLARDTNGFVGTPAPGEIAEAAYGTRSQGAGGDKLLKAALERLIACSIDGRPFPKDVLEACLRRAFSRTGYKDRRVTPLREFGIEREWNKILGIACGLYKGVHVNEGYQMSLEERRTSRDYLFGRMLAIAENIESHALDLVQEKCDTTAARLMQRFADRPCPTWRHIELALEPYRARLKLYSPEILALREKLLDSVIGLFKAGEFVREDKLSGEFLLGYHCQRAELAKALEGANEETIVAEESTRTGRENGTTRKEN